MTENTTESYSKIKDSTMKDDLKKNNIPIVEEVECSYGY
jgi:hypothetical protein